ncbi:GIY-YIG nuclease family protein [Patescibacteria group bacterium]|jgi:putative endonuclease|nr:GIY-YIG nuclease family protein [Patescibacteria group bacterium]
MYFVYIIQCEDGSLYTGITTDIDRRFAEHESGKGSRYTAAHRVEKILYIEGRRTRSEALRREAQIKKLRRKEKLDLVRLA